VVSDVVYGKQSSDVLTFKDTAPRPVRRGRDTRKRSTK
jgi:hypothetical protein